jgi:hypothetical protein
MESKESNTKKTAFANENIRRPGTSMDDSISIKKVSHRRGLLSQNQIGLH